MTPILVLLAGMLLSLTVVAGGRVKFRMIIIEKCKGTAEPLHETVAEALKLNANMVSFEGCPLPEAPLQEAILKNGLKYLVDRGGFALGVTSEVLPFFDGSQVVSRGQWVKSKIDIGGKKYELCETFATTNNFWYYNLLWIIGLIVLVSILLGLVRFLFTWRRAVPDSHGAPNKSGNTAQA